MVYRYKPEAYSRGRWVGFPQVDSYGVKSKAIKFIRQVRKRYKQAKLIPPKLRVRTVHY